MTATTKLTAPNGATVSVASDKVENLLRRHFTEAEPTKAPAKRSAAKKATSTTEK